ncbi:MAG: hypothetical protein N3D12_04275 [Candidatus Methanomethyliaceae archaeon]|nr:hypothetical protein [Candidatus Methanomethyliaceae archaeon]
MKRKKRLKDINFVKERSALAKLDEYVAIKAAKIDYYKKKG